MTEFAATRAEKPKQDKQRITTKILFGNKGSATGPESRKMLAAKQAETQAEKEEKAARNEERNQSKALKVAREVTKGAKLLKALELFGNPKLNSLTLPDLVALLTNVDRLTRRETRRSQRTSPKPCFASALCPLCRTPLAGAL